MKTNKTKGNHLRKPIMAAALIVGASTLIFQGFTQVAVAAVYDKTDVIPTSYANCSTATSQNAIPEGYTKANYTVGSIDLEYYQNKAPDKKDLTKEEAAELAAQYIWEIYGVSLEGQTIEMGYDSDTDIIPRTRWVADVKMKNQDYHDGYRVKSYEVTVDSVTGEKLGICMERMLKANVKAGPDYSIDENTFKAAAKELAVKYNIVGGGIASINCTGQGATFPTNVIGTYGDPDISFEFHGTNGEVASMTISRYDKLLKGITFNGQYKYDLLWIEKNDKEMQADTAADQKAATTTSGDQTSSFILTEDK